MKHRKPSPLQIELLKLLYKFRFATIPLLAEHKQKSPMTITQSIKTLQGKKLIARNYSLTYKLAGRGAEYYLTNTGIKFLRDNYPVNEAVLHAMYKNKSIGQPFIQKCLLIYQTYIKLQKQYGSSLTILTKAEIAGAEGFPEPLPDLYFYSESAEYLLDIFTDNLFYLVKKRIDQLIEHYESGDWPEKDYPTLLLVFPNKSIEAKAQAYIEKVKDDNYIEDGELTILTTTQKALLSESVAIWSTKAKDVPTCLQSLR